MSAPATARRTPLVAERFRFIQPGLPPLERVLEAYAPNYSSGMLTNASTVARLESAVAGYVGVKHCVAVSSCTSGLALTMRALGLKGEVILPSMTFFATGHAVLWNGLRPVFADCDDRTWTLDPADVERRITPRTAAILGVHLYGNPCDIRELEAVAARHRIPLLFDAAHAFGSLYQGAPIGAFGDAEVFSMSPTKLLVAGEGGLVTTNDAALARRLKAGRNYGDLGAYDPELLGLNARMTEFNAALALAGLEILPNRIARYAEIANRYSTILAACPNVRLQQIRPGNRCSFKDFTIRLPKRDEIAEALLADNIETKKYFYPPLHRQKLFKKYKSTNLQRTNAVSEQILSLPIYDALPDHLVETIARAVLALAQ